MLFAPFLRVFQMGFIVSIIIFLDFIICRWKRIGYCEELYLLFSKIKWNFKKKTKNKMLQ